jgi:amidohydrolase
MKALIDDLKPTLLNIFEYLHHHPEVSWKEYETTRYIANFLEEQGFLVDTFDDCTGLMVEIGEGPYIVGVRTDIDALWQEVDGVFQANHSCGHDAHITIVLGVLLLLKKMNSIQNRRLKFIFQPAEEKGTGALKMIEKGIVDNIDFLYGLHLRPIQELKFGKATPAIFHGAAKFITGEIVGEDAHGARPHLGQNSIEVGAAFINEMSKIHLDPAIPYSVKMTKFQAGGDSINIIPGKAQFNLDLRAQTNEAMETLSNRIKKIANTISQLYDVEINLETTAEVAAAEVNMEAQHLMESAIIDTLGKENLVEPFNTNGGEDFHFYTLKRRHIKTSMLGLGCDLYPGLHHPKMTFNKDVLFLGIEILAKTVMKTFDFLEEENAK